MLLLTVSLFVFTG